MTHDDNNKSSLLTKFSLDRRITVFVLFLSILVVGVIAAIGIPLELFPRGYTESSLNVRVPWPDSPTREVLDKVILPLEEELSTVKGMDGIYSYSRTGMGNVWMRFKQGTDMSIAYREVRDRVERARVLFPDGVDRVFIRKEDSSGIPVAVVGIAVDPALSDYYDLVQKEIVLRLERIDGVASVATDGLAEKEIIIEVDRELASSAGLNIYELSQDLGGDNFTMASGHVRDSGKKFLLRSVATYADLETLENRLVSKNVRLKDIAEIKYEEADKRFSVRVNGQPAIAVVIFKEGEANTVAVSHAIRDTVEEMKQNPRLASVYMESLFNQGQIVEESIGSLVDGGKIGAIFAALVLFIFLRRFRLTAIITLSIPLSLLIALCVMYFMGESLNLLTILGLVICVGLLVDNSVVVAENIHRLRRSGLSRRDSCVQGASEIALAIIMATLTTVIVFLPVALIEGEGQFFLLRLALPITVSLIASLFIALIFVPLCVYLTMTDSHLVRKESAFQRFHGVLNVFFERFYDAIFGRLSKLYSRCLVFFLKRRLDLVLVIFGVVMLTSIPLGKVTFVNTQEEDRTSFRIRVEMAKEHDFEDTRQYFQKAEEVLENAKSEFGIRGYLAVHFTRSGRLEGWMDEERETKISVKEISEKVLERLPQRAGVKVYVGQENQASEEDGKEVFVVRLESEDYEILDKVAEDLQPIFSNMDGVLGVKKSGEQAPSELGLVVDREKASASGVNPQFIAGVVGNALRGNSLPRYNDQGKQIPVRIRFREENRENLSDLENFMVPTNDGNLLPVSALTDSKMLATNKGIFRRNKKVTRTITLELKEENVGQTRESLRALMGNLSLPEGVRFGQAPVFSDNEDVTNMIYAGLMSILFIYLLMGFLFESFILPLSIIPAIPLAGIGVWWGHFISAKDLDFLGVVGMVLLIGVVVNNGIVLIDYVNRLRVAGTKRFDALVMGSERRFRPIIMTTMTTIIGMIPLTISKAGSLGFSYKSFGITLIGGMTSATLLTLLVVPIFYTFFDDIRQVCVGLMKSLVSKKGAANDADASTVAPTTT